MTTPLLELHQVNKGFGPKEKRTEVLSDINLTINEGEFVAIVGYSGAGKSTLINLMAGLVFPDAGEVLMGGAPVTGTSLERGIVFQNYSLLPWLSVFENVLLAVQQAFPTWSIQDQRDHTMNYLQMVNLAPAIRKRPSQLSGGMRQRSLGRRAHSPCSRKSCCSMNRSARSMH